MSSEKNNNTIQLGAPIPKTQPVESGPIVRVPPPEKQPTPNSAPTPLKNERFDDERKNKRAGGDGLKEI